MSQKKKTTPYASPSQILSIHVHDKDDKLINTFQTKPTDRHNSNTKPLSKKSDTNIKDIDVEKLLQLRTVKESNSTNRYVVYDNSTKQLIRSPHEKNSEKHQPQQQQQTLMGSCESGKQLFSSSKVSFIKEIIKQELDLYEIRNRRHDSSTSIAKIVDIVQQLKQNANEMSQRIETLQSQTQEMINDVARSFASKLEEVKNSSRQHTKQLTEENIEILQNLFNEASKSHANERKIYESEILRYNKQFLELDSFKQHFIGRLEGLEVKLKSSEKGRDSRSSSVHSETAQIAKKMQRLDHEIEQFRSQIRKCLQKVTREGQEGRTDIFERITRITENMRSINIIVSQQQSALISKLEKVEEKMTNRLSKSDEEMEEVREALSSAVLCFNDNFRNQEQHVSQMQKMMAETIKYLDSISKQQLETQKSLSHNMQNLQSSKTILTQHKDQIQKAQSQLMELRSQVKTLKAHILHNVQISKQHSGIWNETQEELPKSLHESGSTSLNEIVQEPSGSNTQIQPLSASNSNINKKIKKKIGKNGIVRVQESSGDTTNM